MLWILILSSPFDSDKGDLATKIQAANERAGMETQTVFTVLVLVWI